MTKHSRFDNLETERGTGEQAASKPASQRFERVLDAASLPAAGVAAPLNAGRFETDTADVLRLDNKDDAGRWCPRCRRERGRFEERCGDCGGSLLSEEARVFSRAQEAARRQVELREKAERERRQRLAAAETSAVRGDIHEALINDGRVKRHWSKVKVAVAVLAAVVLLFHRAIASPGLRLAVFIVALGTVVVLMPAGLRQSLDETRGAWPLPRAVSKLASWFYRRR